MEIWELEHAIHIVPGDSASGLAKSQGFRSILNSRERFSVGPCRLDPVEHERVRRDLCADDLEVGSPFGLDDLRPALADGRVVAFWAARSWCDLVWLWWFLDAMQRMPVRGAVWLIRPDPGGPFEGVGGCDGEAARAAGGAATLVTDAIVRAGAEMWARYTDPSPLRFDEARRGGSLVFPEVTTAAEAHGGWFPRSIGNKLQLSQLDAIVLSWLNDEWRLSQDIVWPRADFQRVTGPFSVFTPVARLRAWASHGAVDGRRHASDNPWVADSFRLNDIGRRLLADGISAVTDAPPIDVGGCRVNDPRRPWVRVIDPAGWRLLPGTP